MTKISKVIKCLMLSGLLLAANSQKAEAFFFPPMPWDPVLDIPGDASKYVGEALKVKHTLSSGLNLKNATGLLGLKGGILDGNWKKLKEAISPEMDKKNALKSPGKGAAAGSAYLHINDKSLNEEQFFNAYHTLFFTHNFKAADIEGVTPSLLETAYKNKTEEYQQDVAIDTYLSAKLIEDYLTTVDKTLNRLEKCQNGSYNDEECVFFGMKMAKVTDESGSEEGDPNNKAQLAAARNAYIVTMVYDRLLRMVEDLTATEAIFQTSRQMGIAKPVTEGEQQSSADEYTTGKYRFAYTDSQNYVAAKGTPIINFNNRVSKCDGEDGGDPKKCPQLNKDKTEIKGMEDTEVLKKLQPIEGYINKAITVHNLKSSLPQMKGQYRQYLLQKEIHKRAEKLVETSEQCVVNFLNHHAGDNEDMKFAWYGGAEPSGDSRFKYENRKGKGIAGELISEYDEKSINITIGASETCDGLYEENSCPAGYKWTKSENENCKGLGSCGVELITEEAEAGEAITQIDENYTGGKDVSKINAKYKDMADTDGFMDGTNADKTIQDSRKSAELTWYLGREKLLETMEKHEMTFKPWNDQKMLQAEYLRNKYRNIALIIRSTDQAVASFKLAENAAQSYSSEEDVATQYIEAAASCESIDAAKAKADAQYCTSEYKECSVTDNDGMIITKRKKDETRYDRDGNPYIVTVSVPDITENQKVSLGSTCVYKKGASAVNLDEICLTPTCLVKKYFSKAWKNADGFYDAAKGKERVVAVNKLQAVITERKKQENNVKTLVEKYQKQIRETKIEVENAVAALSSTNKAIDEARKNKNIANEELGKTNRRLAAIDQEITTLKNRKDNVNKEDLCAKEQRIGNLTNEKSCLDTGKPQAYTCTSCKGLPGLSKYEQNCSKQVNCDDFLTTFNEKAANRYIAVPSAEAQQDKYQDQIEEKTAQLTTLKDRVKTLQDKLTSLTEEFAEEYLKAENDAQKAIEEKNQEYEDFMVTPSGEEQRYQMRNANKTECYKKGPLGIGCKKKGPKRIEKNNLEATFTNIISNKDLEKVMEDELNRVFFADNKVVKLLTEAAGVPASFVVDETFSAIGISSGATTAQALADQLKDNVVRIAAKELTAKITAADKKVEEAVNEGEDKVKEFMDAHNINGNSTSLPEPEYLKYLEKPSADHQPLLNELRNISKSLIADENVFGIPEDEEFAAMLGLDKESENIADTAFFVGLPARSNNYRDKAAVDTNAGRDYIAPHDMLASLPPLREVFYFSAADYEDIPQKKGKPVLTELLKGKYCNEHNRCEYEYLPEVWLHILARPNLREDKKYQQTFIERSFSDAKLNDLVQNRLANSGIPNAKASDYRAIIGRSGVYPCKTQGGGIVDMGGGDEDENMHFKTRSSLPAGMTSVPNCQEVELKGVNAYHLLADHGKGENIKDTEKTSPTNEPMYEKHSELGQLLTEEMAYRPLQKNIHEYLNNSKNEDNNIERQKAELASFKRNVMGGFLVAVTTEYNARKTLESMQKTVDTMMENLCTQLAEIWKENDEEYDVEGCKKQALASNYKDTAYFEQDKEEDKDNDYDYGKINCPQGGRDFYEQVFCDLDTKKDGYIEKAQAALNLVEAQGAPTEEAKAYLEERLEKIKNYIEADEGTLIVDNKEISTIQPDIDRAEIKGVVLTAKANRRVMLDSVEEGLQATENQNQAVAYCPVY